MYLSGSVMIDSIIYQNKLYTALSLRKIDFILYDVCNFRNNARIENEWFKLFYILL